MFLPSNYMCKSEFILEDFHFFCNHCYTWIATPVGLAMTEGLRGNPRMTWPVLSKHYAFSVTIQLWILIKNLSKSFSRITSRI